MIISVLKIKKILFLQKREFTYKTQHNVQRATEAREGF